MPARAVSPSGTGGKIRVVIADDTADVRALLRYTLDLDGRFEVVGQAADGREAIAVVEVERPDAVVLDLAMPVVDGMQALPEILHRVPTTKVVVLSGFDAGELSKEALQRGAAAYLEKGATFNDLTAILADICSAPIAAVAPASDSDHRPHVRSTREITGERTVGREDEGVPQDPTLRDREVVMRQARWIGVLFALVQFTLYKPPAHTTVPFPLLPAGLAVAATLVLVNLASLLAVRRWRDDRFLRLLGRVELGVDVLIVLAIVVLFSFDPTSALWALLIIPVMEGAVRGGMGGAVVAWGLAAVGYVGREVWAAAHFGDVAHQLQPESMTYRLCVVLLVAVTTGHLAQNLADHARRNQRERSESDQRARLLALVAAASRTMASLDSDSLLDAVVDAVAALGFDGVELCVFDAPRSVWTGVRRRHMPERAGREEQPINSGIAGAVRARGETLLVDDYQSWPEGLPESREAGFRSTVGTPIWTAGEMMAALVVGRKGDEPISPHEIECLELLAAQAGVGLSNVRLLEQMRHQALHDALTGLPNQVLFEDRVGQALSSAGRTGTRTALLFLDLDRFKKVNDSLGHDVGNELLKQVAGRLLGAVRRGDTVARMGGDEFTLLLPGIAEDEDARVVAEKICGAFHTPFDLGGQELFISPSIGIALYPSDGLAYATLLKHADIAMYRVKAKGGSGYEVFGGSTLDSAYPRLALEADLHNALDVGQLAVVYQPLVDLRTDIVVGVEALVRWNHHRLGVVRPDEFIPLAEEAGLIIAIDSWVLREACAQLRRWLDLGLPPVRLSVNMSGRHLQHPRMAHSVLEALHAEHLDPSLLELEITESVAVAEAQETQAALDSLRRVGVHIAIDDFGTGYSMLSRLRQMPLDTLKIDRSFVNEITNEHDDGPIVSSTISMAHSLGLEVVAEGVETPEQLAFLRRHGCDRAQGYLLSRPVDAMSIERMLAGAALRA